MAKTYAVRVASTDVPDRPRPSTPAKIDVRVSEKARRGWDTVAREHDVTLSALIEAIGVKLADDNVRHDMEWVDGLFELAREIDRERRAR